MAYIRVYGDYVGISADGLSTFCSLFSAVHPVFQLVARLQTFVLCFGPPPYLRWTPHPVIVAIRDNRDYIRVLLYSNYLNPKP